MFLARQNHTLVRKESKVQRVWLCVLHRMSRIWAHGFAFARVRVLKPQSWQRSRRPVFSLNSVNDRWT